MDELKAWLSINKIIYSEIDDEVLYLDGFGKIFLADLEGVKSIFREKNGEVHFNLLENPEILLEEEIYHVVFKFGDNWYYNDLREEFNMKILKYIGCRIKPSREEKFVNLGIHTPFELLNGSFQVSSWIQKAKHMGQTAIGVCDKNTMASLLNLQKTCKDAGMKQVFGYSLDCRVNETEIISLKIYCLSQEGLKNLLRVQKKIMVDNEDNTISVTDLAKRGKGNVLVFGTLTAKFITSHENTFQKLKEAFDLAFYQFDATEYKADRFDVEELEALKYYMKNIYGSGELPPVLICDNYYLDQEDAKNKVILNKIAKGAAHKQSMDQYFKDVDEHHETISKIFSEKWDVDELFGEMCYNTLVIANQAEACFETGKMFMPEYILTDEEKVKYETKHNMFIQLIEEGLQKIIPTEDHPKYRERIEEERYIIESTNNVDYFLVQYDMVREARKRGIAVGIGRGSAGGCLISYLIGLTSIDPLKYDLLFSRFLVPERCGLEWDNVTIIGQDVSVRPGEEYVEIDLEGKKLAVFKDAEIKVQRGDEKLTVYADELEVNDGIILDNRDVIWTIREILSNRSNSHVCVN